MKVRCRGKNNKYSFPGRRRRERGEGEILDTEALLGKILTNNMAMKQQHKTVEMAANDTKIGWNCDSDREKRKTTGFKIQTRDIHNPRGPWYSQYLTKTNKEKNVTSLLLWFWSCVCSLNNNIGCANCLFYSKQADVWLIVCTQYRCTPGGGPGNLVKLLFGDVSPDLSCPIEVIH